MKKFVKYIMMLLFPVICRSQSVDSILNMFPGEKAVLRNYSIHYKISLKDDQPVVESDENQQLQYLSGDAAGYMSRYGFTYSGFQQLVKYEAFTVTPDNRKLKVNEFKTSDAKEQSVFYDDVKQTSFDFPAIAPGSIGNLHVSRINKEAHLLAPFFFGWRLPVLHSELIISFPKELAIAYQLLGKDTASIQVTKEIRHGENIYSFVYKNFPGDKNYEDGPNDSWYAPHVVFSIDHYKNSHGETVNYLSGIDDLYRLNYGFVKQINQAISPETQLIIDSLVKQAKSDEEKARNIYSWVQQHVKYVAFEDGMEGFIPRDANLVCKRRFGDCKDMSSILTLMLKGAGLKAYYTWIGTRHLAYAFSKTPLPLVSNHMICTLNLNGKYIFLDGTHPTCFFGIPPDGIQGKEALVAINEHEYKILLVPVMDKMENRLMDTTFIEIAGNSITGRIVKQFTGYFAMDKLVSMLYRDVNHEKIWWRDQLQRGSNKFQLDSFATPDLSEAEKISIRAAYTLPDYAKKIDGDLYINLNLVKFFEHEEIDFPKRQVPIEYDYKYHKTFVQVLHIPEGYHVSYLPKSKSYHNEVWGFDLTYAVKENQIVYTLTFDNDWLMLYPSQFELHNKVLENLYPLYRESVNLSKN